MSEILANAGSNNGNNGFLFDGTKLLSEPMLILHQWDVLWQFLQEELNE